MLSPSDMWKVLTLIRHIDGREFARPDAILWAGVVNEALPGATVRQVVDAVVAWQQRPHEFSRIQPYDLIELVRSHSPARGLSERRIGELLESRDLSGDELWAARRELIRAVSSGIPVEEAVERAVESTRGRELPSAPSRPAPTHEHHFAGRLSGSLESVLGASNAGGAGDLSGSTGKPFRTPKEHVSDGNDVKGRNVGS